MLHEINPFVIGKYVSDDYFCDREKETDFIRKQIVNGRNVALIAPRRMGKSDLLKQDDFITQTNGIYRVYDYFFAEWLAQQ